MSTVTLSSRAPVLCSVPGETGHFPKQRLTLTQQTTNVCQCKLAFCDFHLPENQHNCKFNYKEDGRKRLSNVMIPGDAKVQAAGKRFMSKQTGFGGPNSGAC